MNPAEKLWWAKVVASIAVAWVSLAIQLRLDVDAATAVMLGIAIYLSLSDILSRLANIDRLRGLKIGIGAYFFTWLTAWTALYTFFAFG